MTHNPLPAHPSKIGFALLLLVLGIGACAPLQIGPPPPSPQPLHLHYSPIFEPWLEILHGCARENPGIALFTQETNSPTPEPGEGALTLWFGEPPAGFGGYPAALGSTEIVVLAGEGMRLEQLSAADLRAIYTGEEGGYTLWSYAPGNPLRALFEQAVLGGEALSPETRLAPHPAAMLAAMAADPLAIGYAPAHWAGAGVQTLALEANLQAALRGPLLALAASEPEGAMRAYLVCVQTEFSLLDLAGQAP